MSRGVLDSFFDYGIDFRKRLIYLGTPSKGLEEENEVSHTMAEYAIKGLITLDTSGDSAIDLIINSPGGEVSQGLAIYDAIKRCRCHVRALVLGGADSMASIILQACDERVVAPHATVMVHEGSLEVYGKSADVRSYMQYDAIVEKACQDIYLKRIKEKHPRFTRKKLQEMLLIDKWMTAKEAVNIGLADAILDYSGE